MLTSKVFVKGLADELGISLERAKAALVKAVLDHERAEVDAILHSEVSRSQFEYTPQSSPRDLLAGLNFGTYKVSLSAKEGRNVLKFYRFDRVDEHLQGTISFVELKLDEERQRFGSQGIPIRCEIAIAHTDLFFTPLLVALQTKGYITTLEPDKLVVTVRDEDYAPPPDQGLFILEDSFKKEDQRTPSKKEDYRDRGKDRTREYSLDRHKKGRNKH